MDGYGYSKGVGKMEDKKTDATPLVQIKNCTMEFPGVKALSEVNFTLMPGECHALVGENGAGDRVIIRPS